MTVIIACMVFATVTTLVLSVGLSYHRRVQVETRLSRYGHKAVPLHTSTDSPLSQRLLRPFVKQIAQSITSFTPQQTKDRLRRQLLMAGNPGQLQAAEFVAIKVLMGVVGIASGYVLPVSAIWVFIGGSVGYLLPDYFLKYLVRQRQKAIALAIPDMLDLLTVSVEAGLGFDAAVAKVVEKSRGALAEEFQRTLQEIRVGKPRKDALRNLSLRTGVEYLQGITAAIIQADQLGVSIGKVLRIQSIEIRRKRRQRAEEEAMKAPIKMLFPLVLLVFPTVFIVLLGPALLRFMESF